MYLYFRNQDFPRSQAAIISMKAHLPPPEEDKREPRRDSDLAAELRGFGPVGIMAIVIIIFSGNITSGIIAIPVGAVLVLVWVRLARLPWSIIGYGRPKSWSVTIAMGLVFGIAFKLLMKVIVMPLLGAPADNTAYHYLAGNNALLPFAILAMLNAGFSEETLFRGYMFERLGKLIGHGIAPKLFILLFTSLWFGFDHYAMQGMAGAEQAFIAGLVYGTIFYTTGKIWLVMFAHAAFDLTALAIIYFSLEEKMAHLIFR